MYEKRVNFGCCTGIIYLDLSFRNLFTRSDPIQHISRDPGIRIVVGMAEVVRHIPAMGLNNLLVIVNPSHDVQDPAAR